MNFYLVDIMLPFIGIFIVLIDIANAAISSGVDKQTNIYGVMKGCFSLGEIEVTIDLNLTDAISNKTKEYQTLFRLPDDVYKANCSQQTSNLTLVSRDGTLMIDLAVKLQTEDTNYATMEITDIQVNSPNDMSEIEAIKPIILSKRGGPSRNRTLAYQSLYNETIECSDRNQRVIFHSPRAQAAIVFSQVRLQPYSKFIRLENGKGVICPHDLRHNSDSTTAHSEIFIPLILAVALTIVILLIVIGYFVHKKIEGMGYTSME